MTAVVGSAMEEGSDVEALDLYDEELRPAKFKRLLDD
jgi:hypothetical protein